MTSGSGGQRLDHRAVPAVGEHGRAGRQHVGMPDPPPDQHVARSADHRGVHRRAGGHQRVDREPSQRIGGALQQVLLAHHGTAQADQDQRAAVRAGRGPSQVAPSASSSCGPTYRTLPGTEPAAKS